MHRATSSDKITRIRHLFLVLGPEAVRARGQAGMATSAAQLEAAWGDAPNGHGFSSLTCDCALLAKRDRSFGE